MALSTDTTESWPASRRERHSPIFKWILGALIAWGAFSIVYGCSVYMEATRPEPVNLKDFPQGGSREAVRSKLGLPVLTTTENGNECDTYHLYTHAIGAAGRAPIMIMESAADVFTLGLAEAVLTPGEALTRNSKYPVTFCYKDDKLIEVTESQQPVAGQ